MRVALTTITIAAVTVAGVTVPREAAAQAPPLRVGVLADAQLQDLDARSSVLPYYHKDVDRLVNVSVRPYALDRFSQLLCERLLAQVLAAEPDVVLYLGDGANHGSKRELKRIFGLLEAARDRAKVPFFFVIGNHDYLGSGNTTDPRIRARLVAKPKDVASKADVLARIDAFNRASLSFARGKRFRWTYRGTSVAAAREAEEAAKRSKDAPHTRAGCTYAGIATARAGAMVYRVYLLDTSNYDDEAVPRIGPVELAGARGGVSEEQIERVEALLDAHADEHPRPNVQVFATHYPRDALGFPIVGGVNAWRGEELAPLFARSGRGGQLWLSGHTHAHEPSRPEPASFWTGFWPFHDDHPFTQVNFGSTTDHRPHAALVTVRPRDAEGAKAIVKPIRLEVEAAAARLFASVLRGQGPPLRRVAGLPTALDQLGATRAYRTLGFTQDALFRQNLTTLETWLRAPQRAPHAEDVWVLVALAAAEVEETGAASRAKAREDAVAAAGRREVLRLLDARASELQFRDGAKALFGADAFAGVAPARLTPGLRKARLRLQRAAALHRSASREGWGRRPASERLRLTDAQRAELAQLQGLRTELLRIEERLVPAPLVPRDRNPWRGPPPTERPR